MYCGNIKKGNAQTFGRLHVLAKSRPRFEEQWAALFFTLFYL